MGGGLNPAAVPLPLPASSPRMSSDQHRRVLAVLGFLRS